MKDDREILYAVMDSEDKTKKEKIIFKYYVHLF